MLGVKFLEVTLLSIVISITNSTISSELEKILGVSQYHKAKLTAALTEGYLHSLLWQEKRRITTHLVNPQEIRRFDFFLENEYSKAFVFDLFLRNRLQKLHMVCWTGMYNNLPRQVFFWSTNLFYFVLI